MNQIIIIIIITPQSDSSCEDVNRVFVLSSRRKEQDRFVAKEPKTDEKEEVEEEEEGSRG